MELIFEIIIFGICCMEYKSLEIKPVVLVTTLTIFTKNFFCDSLYKFKLT